MYSVGGKIVSVGNRFPENKVNTLTFQVKGDQFPDRDLPDIDDSRNNFFFESDSENSVVVNWGDGTTESFIFGTDTNGFRVGWTSHGRATDDPQNSIATNTLIGDTIAGRHIYTDGNSGLRTITFEFKSLQEILYNAVNFTRLSGSYPIELGFAKKLEEIILIRTRNLTGLPESLKNISNINSVRLANSFTNRLEAIPDGFFNNALVSLNGSGSFDLGKGVDSNLTSNFFKVNQLSQTLKTLNFETCNISTLPEEINQLVILEALYIGSQRYNDFENQIINPQVLEPLENLSKLYLSVSTLVTEWWDLSLWVNLSALNIYDSKMKCSLPFDDLVNVWKDLKSLKKVLPETVLFTIYNFDDFVDGFYELCTVRGFLDSSSTEAQNTGYPEQFRDVYFGHSSVNYTGNIQAPSGFSQGISNGTPANQGEKIYVLVNNYGHTITTS
jgi:hypothetical protein